MPRYSHPWYRSCRNSWYVTLNGKKIALGVQGKGNKTEAYRVWRELLSQEKPATFLPVQHTSLPDLISLFLLHLSTGIKPKTVSWYRQFLSQVPSLNPIQIDLFIKKKKWSASTKRGFLVSVKALIKWAVKNHYLNHDPLSCLTPPPMSSRGEKALIRKEDHLKIIKATSGDFKILLQLLWDTGARPTEISLVTDKTFKPESGVIIPEFHKMSRKGSSRVICLPQSSVLILNKQMLRYRQGYLLRNAKGFPFDKDAIVCKLRRLRIKTGVKNLTAYGYRHTFATNALASGVPESQVAALLGHSGTAMLERHYNHLLSKIDILREALKKIKG